MDRLVDSEEKQKTCKTEKVNIMKKLLVISVLLLSAVFLTRAQSQKILFVMSAEDTLLLNKGKKERQTGVFLNEFYLAYKAIIKEGYMVDFATPGGFKATVDLESLDEKYWEEKPGLKDEALEFWNKDEKFAKPITLEKAIKNYNKYIGIVIPGGQGLMVDLIYDTNIPVLLKIFAENQKAVGLICHAPALITTIPEDQNPFIGYKVNSVSPIEEIYIEKLIMKGKPKNRMIAKQLKNLGLKYERGKPGKNFSTRDRNLVTSQNPFSGESFNALFLDLLSEY
jgi:putative intracellular protease/amidase